MCPRMITPKEIRTLALKRWNSGRVLRAWLSKDDLFPIVISLGRPSASQLLQDFLQVDRWKQWIEKESRCKTGHGYRLEYLEINHRQIGRQRLPQQAIFDHPTDLIDYIGKQRQLTSFASLARMVRSRFPQLESWIEKSPMKLLQQADNWQELLSVLEWFYDHPRPNLYLRELDIPEVDSKFIERHKGVLAELLDQLLPPHAIDNEVTGFAHHGFERRFGLRYDQPQIRFRLLDQDCAKQFGGLSDITLPLDQFIGLDPPCKRVFITENKINGLSFPPVQSTIVIFGLGYGISCIRDADWLKTMEIYYWGDIDTHGFSILSQLRGYFAKTQSFLMDIEALKNNRQNWVTEDENKRFSGKLNNLTDEEQQTYHQLQVNRLGENLRLEQERIPFKQLEARLALLKNDR